MSAHDIKDKVMAIFIARRLKMSATRQVRDCEPQPISVLRAQGYSEFELQEIQQTCSKGVEQRGEDLELCCVSETRQADRAPGVGGRHKKSAQSSSLTSSSPSSAVGGLSSSYSRLISSRLALSTRRLADIRSRSAFL